ncbi:MAG TPA: MFS transporter, partial [Hyphomicrobiales bacterium]|nr:MFS transporter [Hyphomicrobiales bacterium]
RTDVHIARLHESVNWAREPAVEALNNLTGKFQSFGSDAHNMALQQLMRMAHREGVVMAFSDVFLFLTVLSVGLSVLAIFIKRPKMQGGAGGGH